MKKPKDLFRLISILGVYITFHTGLFAQDIHFSQLAMTPILNNPGNTGVFNGNHRVLLNYKNQWANFTEPYQTYALSYDSGILKRKITKGYLGVGFYAFSDKAGDSEYGTTQLMPSVSGVVPITNNQVISFGLQGGFAQRSISNQNLKYGNQFNGKFYDPSLPTGELFNFNNVSYVDLNAGILWNYYTKASTLSSQNDAAFHFGISVAHLNKPKRVITNLSDIDELYAKMTIHGGGFMGFNNRRTGIHPQFMLNKQGPYFEIIAGAMLIFLVHENSKYTGFIKELEIAAGGYLRGGDAFIPTIQLNMANYSIGINYDINISGLRGASAGKGGIEISLRYVNPNPFRKSVLGNNPLL